jgi:hypothetical protein
MSDDAGDSVREQAAKYRREAQATRERAAAATTPAVQRRLLQSAERLEQLAATLEKTFSRPPS